MKLYEAVAEHLLDSTSVADLALKVNAMRGVVRQARTNTGSFTLNQVKKAVPMAAHSLADDDGPAYPSWWYEQ